MSDTFLLFADGVPESTFRVFAVDGHEAISEPFRFKLEVVATGDIDEQRIAGEDAVFRMRRFDGTFRSVVGVVSSATTTGSAGEARRMTVELVPELWVVGQRRRNRIFQKKRTLEIVELILGELGIEFVSFLSRPVESFLVREYCVQYQESDVDFICRLLAEEGVFFAFSCDDDTCTLELGDGTFAYEMLDSEKANADGVLAFSKTPLTIGEEHFSDFSVRGNIGPQSVVLRDYDHRRPNLDQTVKSTLPGARNARHEVYEFPGDYTNPPDGQLIAARRIKALRRSIVVGGGTGNCRALQPGVMFVLEGHPFENHNRKWVVTSIHHSGEEHGLLDSEKTYVHEIECVPAEVPFLPSLLINRKPTVNGSETARVTGDAKEEIDVDDEGRVHVHMLWDREGPNDSGSSCFIRVAQPWAGAGFGVQFIPRVGMEVVVTFIGGDPDRPLITGCVYNGDHPVPYKLPDHKTRSTIRTRSSPKSDGFNELRFEDAAGKEQIFLHAQQNLDEAINAARTTTVGGKWESTVGSLRTESKSKMEYLAAEDWTLAVGGEPGNSVVDIIPNAINAQSPRIFFGAGFFGFRAQGKHVTLQADESITLKAKTVAADGVASVSLSAAGGAHSLTLVNASPTENLPGTPLAPGVTLKTSRDMVITSDGHLTISGDAIEVSAKSSLTISAGGAFIKFEKGTVEIHGSKVNFTS